MRSVSRRLSQCVPVRTRIGLARSIACGNVGSHQINALACHESKGMRDFSRSTERMGICIMTHQRKTLLLRTYWDEVNIGDMAHAPGTLRVLQRHLPDVDLLVWFTRQYDRTSRDLLKAHFPDAQLLFGDVNEDG